MTVQFETTSAFGKSIIEMEAKPGLDPQTLMAKAFNEIGTIIEMGGVQFKITKVIKFVF